MAAKRMKLIPEQLYNKLMFIAKNEPTQQLETEKTSVLESTMPDEVKVMLYQQAIRNLSNNDKNIANTPLLVKNIDPPPVEEKTAPEPQPAPFSVLDHVHGRRAPRILTFLQGVGIEPSDRNEITVPGGIIPGSNYLELLEQLSGNTPIRQQLGIDRVISILRKQKISQRLFSKKVSEAFTGKENQAETPSRYRWTSI